MVIPFFPQALMVGGSRPAIQRPHRFIRYPDQHTSCEIETVYPEITFRQTAATSILLAGFCLLLIAGFGYLRYLPYFGFFLLCLMGCAFLVITYILKQ